MNLCGICAILAAETIGFGFGTAQFIAETCIFKMNQAQLKTLINIKFN